MMQFDLGGQSYRITADKYQWVLSRYQPGTEGKRPTNEWKAFAYYASLGQMADKLTRLGCDAIQAQDVGVLLAEIGLLREALTAAQTALEAQGIGPTEP